MNTRCSLSSCPTWPSMPSPPSSAILVSPSKNPPPPPPPLCVCVCVCARARVRRERARVRARVGCAGRPVVRESSFCCRFSVPNPYAYDHDTAICRRKNGSRLSLSVSLFLSLRLCLCLLLSLCENSFVGESSRARFRSSPLLSFSRSAAVRGSRTKCYHAQA